MPTSTRLFGDGKHGHAEQIQTFRCQACRTTFSARRHTPLYRLKTPLHQIVVVLSALAEGLDASAAKRAFGSRQATITSWLSQAGEHAQALHERTFSTLRLPHLQLDELRTRLRSANQIRLSLAGHRSAHQDCSGDTLSARAAKLMAHRLIHALRQRLATFLHPSFHQ
jgi:hypothetical protein